MARLQIVQLPTIKLGEASAPEYLLVFDQVNEELGAELFEANGRLGGLRDATGARGVLVFESAIEVL